MKNPVKGYMGLLGWCRSSIEKDYPLLLRLFTQDTEALHSKAEYSSKSKYGVAAGGATTSARHTCHSQMQ